MDSAERKSRLDEWAGRLDVSDRDVLAARLRALRSVFPFNEFEFRLMYLLEHGVIDFAEYEALRDTYSEANVNLELYGLAPRIFGEIWEQHLRCIDSRLLKPSKASDPEYDGDYDLYLEEVALSKLVRIEVKAARAIETNRIGNLVEKALTFSSSLPFWMNFQQIKLTIVDAFIFVGVWTDTICYWVLSNADVEDHPDLSHQHRGGVEYQIGITDRNIRSFDEFLVQPSEIVDKIISKMAI